MADTDAPLEALEPEPELVTIAEAAELTGISKRGIQSRITRRTLTVAGHDPGGRRLVRRADLEAAGLIRGPELEASELERAGPAPGGLVVIESLGPTLERWAARLAELEAALALSELERGRLAAELAYAVADREQRELEAPEGAPELEPAPTGWARMMAGLRRALGLEHEAPA